MAPQPQRRCSRAIKEEAGGNYTDVHIKLLGNLLHANNGCLSSRAYGKAGTGDTVGEAIFLRKRSFKPPFWELVIILFWKAVDEAATASSDQTAT